MVIQNMPRIAKQKSRCWKHSAFLMPQILLPIAPIVNYQDTQTLRTTMVSSLESARPSIVGSQHANKAPRQFLFKIEPLT